MTVDFRAVCFISALKNSGAPLGVRFFGSVPHKQKSLAAEFSGKQVDTMKVKNSLKSLKGRHRANRLVRRKGRVYIINKVNPRFKARQG